MRYPVTGWKIATPRKGAGLSKPMAVPILSGGDSSRMMAQATERVPATIIPMMKKTIPRARDPNPGLKKAIAVQFKT